jgi:asparagine synthetase B (glutamine-hydrolysing)
LLKLKDESEYVDAFIELFSRAVASRVNGADASMLLSGGIDSASIAATLCRLGKSIDSYSMVSPSEQSDPETEAIRLLQASTSIRGTGHSIATDQLAACLSELESIAWSHSDPVDNSILLSGLLANQAGRKHRVLLHGAAGDIVQGSFNRMPGKLMRQGRLIRAWRASADLSKNHTYSRHLGTGRIFLSNLWASFAPEPIRRIRTRLLINKQKKLKHVARLDILTPEYERSIQLREQLVAQLNDDFSPRPITEQDLWNYEEVKSLVQSANSGYERIASRAGMVARDPWADRDVIEFYCQLPPEVTAGHGWNKYLARLASAEELPAEVCWRKDKMHLGWHVIDQLLHGGSQSVMERLAEVRPWLAAYIRPEVLERLAAESLASDDEELVFDLLTAGYWLKRLDS